MPDVVDPELILAVMPTIINELDTLMFVNVSWSYISLI